MSRTEHDRHPKRARAFLLHAQVQWRRRNTESVRNRRDDIAHRVDMRQLDAKAPEPAWYDDEPAAFMAHEADRENWYDYLAAQYDDDDHASYYRKGGLHVEFDEELYPDEYEQTVDPYAIAMAEDMRTYREQTDPIECRIGSVVARTLPPSLWYRESVV